MAQPQDHISMALFCDFENVALGVRDANYDKFDIKRVLERLLLKGSIVVKKAYCDWERYKGFKAAMHEANFELIEIPHVRQSGKNSADIRLVVDALDLCYTKSHVNTFVIISGDSDFSPLVSKLRENAKYVIGVGVKQSTSDLLTANCDEFIFYDDLVRESQRQRSRDNRDQQPQQRRSPEEEKRRREEMDVRRTKVVEMVAETYEALVTDRDEGGRVWASMIKEALKRRNPGFSEQYYGFRTFGNLLEEAQGRGLLELGRDEKSGLFVFRGSGVVTTRPEASSQPPLQDSYTRAEALANAQDTQARQSANEARDDDNGVMQDAGEAPATLGGDMTDRPRSGRGRQRGGRKSASQRASMPANAAPTGHNVSMADEHMAPQNDTHDTADMPSAETAPAAPAPQAADSANKRSGSRTSGRTGSRSSGGGAAGGGANARAGTRGGNKAAEAAPATTAPAASMEAPAQAAPESSPAEATAEPASKAAPRSRRPRKPAAKKTTAA